MTADNKVELKSCPFCGGEAELEESHAYRTWIISCKTMSCVAEMEMIEKDEVIAAWNRRASSGDARVLDELEKWLDIQHNLGPDERAIDSPRVVKAKLSELRTTAKEEKK